MNDAPADARLECVDCGERAGLDARRCPACDGVLVPRADATAADAATVDAAWPADSMWSFDALLPFASDGAVSTGEGATPLVDCPALAEELDVGGVLCKDEGQNPTGTAADRELSIAVTAARERGATDVALPSTGADAVAAAAYGARAGLDVHAFVPTRSSHETKAMINVHAGDMSVVEGRLPDAVEAYESAAAEEPEWVPLAPGAAPLRVAGAGTVLIEVLAARDWAAPDAVVVPTGHGVGVVGAALAAERLRELGLLTEDLPIYAAQAEGCAPIARADREGADAVSPWGRPDTIAGALEVPDPALGTRALEAVRESGGGAVAVEDEAILESACSVAAAEGIQASVAGGAAAAGAWELAQEGALGEGDEVVLVNTGAGSLDADVLRSHLMRAGV